MSTKSLKQEISQANCGADVHMLAFINEATRLTPEEEENLKRIQAQGRNVSLILKPGRYVIEKSDDKANESVDESKYILEDFINDELTSREQEILDLILQGCSYDECAEKSNIVRTTLKTFMNNIFQKKQVNSRGELITKSLNPKGNFEFYSRKLTPRENAVLHELLKFGENIFKKLNKHSLGQLLADILNKKQESEEQKMETTEQKGFEHFTDTAKSVLKTDLAKFNFTFREKQTALGMLDGMSKHALSEIMVIAPQSLASYKKKIFDAVRKDVNFQSKKGFEKEFVSYYLYGVFNLTEDNNPFSDNGQNPPENDNSEVVNVQKAIENEQIEPVCEQKTSFDEHIVDICEQKSNIKAVEPTRNQFVYYLKELRNKYFNDYKEDCFSIGERYLQGCTTSKDEEEALRAKSKFTLLDEIIKEVG